MRKCAHFWHRFMKISKKEQRRRLGLSLVWLRECGKSRVVASTTTFPTYNIKSRLRAASSSFWNTASGFAASVPEICALYADRGNQKTRTFSGKCHCRIICNSTRQGKHFEAKQIIWRTITVAICWLPQWGKRHKHHQLKMVNVSSTGSSQKVSRV